MPKKARKRKSQDSSSGGEEEAKPSQTIDYKVVKRNGALKHNFEELIKNPKYIQPDLLGACEPKDFNLSYFETPGLTKPLFFQCDPKELGMKMPNPETFSEDDVLTMVGPRREVEVVVVEDQSSRTVNLETLIDYYKNPDGRDLTNMLSLEFSYTKLRDFVDGPAVVNQLDWINKYYPDNLLTRTVYFNAHDNFEFHQQYPAVQRYCLMSTKGCYTDFHIDFGGTSVWYHVLKGEKHFFLIPPDEQNLVIYDQWQKHYERSAFLGDIVEKCVRLSLKAGDTAIIPSGWLHSVYTPVKSLVFGGNFLHSYAAGMQCKIYNLEQKFRIGMRYRYPFFEEIHFYTIAKIVEECTGRRYMGPVSRNPLHQYVGKDWIAEQGHHIPISWEWFMELDRSNKLKRNQKAPSEPPAIPEDEQMIFYDSPAQKTRGKSYSHKDALDLEPAVICKQEVLDTISKPLLIGYEYMLDFFFAKKCVELPLVITRPSSLLYCFQSVLLTRRNQLVEKGILLPEPPNIYTPPRTKTPTLEFSSNYKQEDHKSRPESVLSDRSEELGYFEDIVMDTAMPSQSKSEETLVETKTEEENIKEETPVSEEVDEAKTGEVKSEEAAAEDQEDENGDAEDNEEVDKPERKKKETKKEKKEKTPKASKSTSSSGKRKHASLEKKKKSSFEEAINPKEKKKKHDPKKDKPEFVGGLPMNPLTGPARENDYHYDPMNEMMPLGTGQLRSAYRKSKFNIAPPKTTKIYKLEHKPSTEEEEPAEEEPFYSEHMIPRAPGGSFIPDFPPMTTSPLKPMSLLPHETYSPTAPPSEYERRFSVGTADRPSSRPDFRDRSISLDQAPPVHDSSMETSDSVRSTPKIRKTDLYDTDYFVKTAPGLIEKLDALTKRLTK